jgi:threonine/homoserine/homoserine lactone efflux protein
MQLERKGQKLIFASIVFALAVSYPFVTIANKKKQWTHIPLLYLYLFIVWFVFIIWIAIIADRKSRK